MNARVLGIDPGTAVTGYGVVEPEPGRHGRLIECGIIRSTKSLPLATRLESIYEGVTALIEKHHPEAVAVESVFHGRNVRTTVALGHARGVILLAVARAGLELAEFPPSTVKRTIVGNGGAAKAQVAYMVQRLLQLKSAPEPSDAADGIALALTYLLTTKGRT